jgi:HEAT repeat protein
MKITLLILQVLVTTAVCSESAAGQSLDQLNRFIQAQAPSAAATAFREARDLIKEGEWEKAEARFNRFIAEFPKDREVAAALYWLAFSLKQQSKFPAADATLTRLIEQYPASTWVGDARTMRVEMAPRLKNSQVIEQGVSEANEEIRLAALQSLFEARPERALTIATDILKAGSSSSRLMKEGALALLADSETKEAIPILAQVARSDTDMRLRRKAIEALGDFEDEPAVVDELVKLLSSEKDPRLLETLIDALEDLEFPQATSALMELARSSSSAAVRRQAIEKLADREDDNAAQSLIQLYDAEKDERMKEDILEALAESEQKPALQKLSQVALRDSSLRLRKRALALMGESDDPDVIKFLEEMLKKN